MKTKHKFLTASLLLSFIFLLSSMLLIFGKQGIEALFFLCVLCYSSGVGVLPMFGITYFFFSLPE